MYSNESIHKQKQVNVENIEEQTEVTKEISEFNSKVWNEKKSQNLSLKDSIKIDGNKIYLPEISTIKNQIDLKNFRGIADFIALKLKFHNVKIYNYFKPREKLFLELYDALEETRIVSLGSTYLKGISSNLKTRLNNFCKTKSTPSR